jgi:predicted esterase
MAELRIPETSDFPNDITVTIVHPQNEKLPYNILILLHGMGDTHAPFAALAKNLNFPETACLAIRGPQPLPFDMNGFHWGDDVIFDSSTGGLDMESAFNRSHEVLKKIIDEILVGTCGWSRRSIFFLGFGQGGMVALDFTSRFPAKGSDGEYGGVVSIGGPLPTTAPSPGQKAKTPILLLGAERNSAITEGVEARVRNVFDVVNVVKWHGRNADGMIKCADEVRPIHEFFARRLKSRAGILPGAVELS